MSDKLPPCANLTLLMPLPGAICSTVQLKDRQPQRHNSHRSSIASLGSSGSFSPLTGVQRVRRRTIADATSSDAFDLTLYAASMEVPHRSDRFIFYSSVMCSSTRTAPIHTLFLPAAHVSVHVWHTFLNHVACLHHDCISTRLCSAKSSHHAND